MLKVFIYFFCFDMIYSEVYMYGRYFFLLFLGMVEDVVMGIVSGVMGVYYVRYVD